MENGESSGDRPPSAACAETNDIAMDTAPEPAAEEGLTAEAGKVAVEREAPMDVEMAGTAEGGANAVGGSIPAGNPQPDEPATGQVNQTQMEQNQTPSDVEMSATTPPLPPVASPPRTFATPSQPPRDLHTVIRAAQQSSSSAMISRGSVPPSPIVEPGALHGLGDINTPGRRQSSISGIAGLEELRDRIEAESQAGPDETAGAEDLPTADERDELPTVHAYARLDFEDGHIFFIRERSVIFGRAEGTIHSFQYGTGPNGSTIIETGARGFGDARQSGLAGTKRERKKRKKKKYDPSGSKSKSTTSGASPGSGELSRARFGLGSAPQFTNPFGVESIEDPPEPIIHLPITETFDFSAAPPRKNISRRHARLAYNPRKKLFEFEVLGKNGAWVDDEFLNTGSSVCIEHNGMKIQIGGVSFTINLPSLPGRGFEVAPSVTAKPRNMSFAFHDEHGKEIRTDPSEVAEDVVMADGGSQESDELPSEEDSGEQSDEEDADEAEDDAEGDDEEDDSPNRSEVSLSAEPVTEPKRGRGRPKKVELDKRKGLDESQKEEARKERERKRAETVSQEKEKREREKREREKQRAKEREQEREKRRQVELQKQREREERLREKEQKRKEKEAERLKKKMQAEKKELKLYLPTSATGGHAIPQPPTPQQEAPVPGIPNQAVEAALQISPTTAAAPTSTPLTTYHAHSTQTQQQSYAGAIDPALYETSASPITPASAHPQGALQEKSKKSRNPPRKIERSLSPEPREEDYTPEQLAKPSHSYVVMCHEAILSSAEKALSLPQIYKAIERKYPYFKFRVATTGWQSSVRHNLGQNKIFRKVERAGKGWLWGVVEGMAIEREKKPVPKQQQQQQPTHEMTMNGQGVVAPQNGQMHMHGGVKSSGYSQDQAAGFQQPHLQLGYPQPHHVQPSPHHAPIPQPPSYMPVGRSGQTQPPASNPLNARTVEAPIPNATATTPCVPDTKAAETQRVIVLLEKLIQSAMPRAAQDTVVRNAIEEIQTLIGSIQAGSTSSQDAFRKISGLVAIVKQGQTTTPSPAPAPISTPSIAPNLPPTIAAPTQPVAQADPAASPTPPAAPSTSTPTTSPTTQQQALSQSVQDQAAGKALAKAPSVLSSFQTSLKNMTREERLALTARLLALKEKKAQEKAGALQPHTAGKTPVSTGQSPTHDGIAPVNTAAAAETLSKLSPETVQSLREKAIAQQGMKRPAEGGPESVAKRLDVGEGHAQ